MKNFRKNVNDEIIFVFNLNETLQMVKTKEWNQPRAVKNYRAIARRIT